MDNFPLTYVFDVQKDIKFNNTEIVFDSQKKQIQRHAINPLKQWKIKCRGTNDQRKTLENFFDNMGGNATPFYFTDEDNVQRTVRFATGGLTINETRPLTGEPVGFYADVVLEIVL